jgi:CRP/FNR family transcriptional regulator, cyclic AMP receptor protein
VPSTALPDKRAAIASHALFSSLTDADRDQLLALGVKRQYPDGQLIFRRGDPGNGMMLVLRGQVRISIVSEDGKELIFSIIPPGECFGEIALLDGRPRSADAIAVGECVLLVLARPDFLAFLERHPSVTIRLLEVLCARVRATSDFIEQLAFLSLPARLACQLLKLAASFGVATPAGIHIAGKFSQQDLGNLAAASRESVNKQLRAWQDAGLLKIEQGTITLLQPTALSRLAHSPAF